MKRFAVVGHGSFSWEQQWKYLSENFDFYYLQDEKFDYLKDYEAILIFAGGAYIKKTKLIREAAPKAKILFNLDDDMMWDTGAVAHYDKPLQYYYNVIFPYIDGYIRNSVRQWSLPVPDFYFAIPRKMPKIEPMEKKEYVGVMHHFMSYPRSQIEAITRAGFKAKIFSGMMHTKPAQVEGYLRCCGVSDDLMRQHILMNHMGGPEYLRELTECRYCIEDPENYYGFSRFTCESAMMNIPVIGNRFIQAMVIAFPELITNPQDQNAQIALLKRLQSEPEFYNKLAVLGAERSIQDSCEETITAYLLRAMRAVGVNV